MPRDAFVDAILGVVKNGLDPNNWIEYFEAASSPSSIDEAAAQVLTAAGVTDPFSPPALDLGRAARIAWQIRKTFGLLRGEIEQGQTDEAVRLALQIGALSVVLSALAIEKDVKRGRKVIVSASSGGKKKGASKRRKTADRDNEIAVEMKRLVEDEKMSMNSAATTLSKRFKLSPRQILNVWRRSRSTSVR